MPQSPLHKGARVILLHAPQRPVTINGGMPFNSWCDIKKWSLDSSEDERYNIDELREGLQELEDRVQQ